MEGMRMASTTCPGPLRRREFLRLGLVGLGSLAWPELLRRRAEAGSNRTRGDTALLVVWLHGGASHLETYDPKPVAPAEYRGPLPPHPHPGPWPAGLRTPSPTRLGRPPLHAAAPHSPTPVLPRQRPSSSSPASRSRSTASNPPPDLFAIVDKLRTDPSRRCRTTSAFSIPISGLPTWARPPSRSP